jgi:hypothetical protein
MSVVRVRSEHARNGIVDPVWRTLFAEFPPRFMVGTDTFTPERWFYVVAHAAWSRGSGSTTGRPKFVYVLPGTLRKRCARIRSSNVSRFLQTLSSNSGYA